MLLSSPSANRECECAFRSVIDTDSATRIIAPSFSASRSSMMVRGKVEWSTPRRVVLRTVRDD